MNSREELLFTESFISALKVLGVNTIPFANNLFKDGVNYLKSYILSQKESFDVINDIEILFIKRPIEGDYDRLKNAFEFFNGKRLRYYNPWYEQAKIETSKDIADSILNSGRSKIPKKILMKAAEEFCKGAQIKY